MKYNKDGLGNRMKEYEMQNRSKLMKKVPIIIRLDGKSFHTYTRGMKRPFDEKLGSAMKETMKFLCTKIPQVRLGYTQSDEITLVLTNDTRLDSDTWFDNQIQKIVSISAAMATFKFNEIMYSETNKMALFDSRVFTVPNYIEASNCVYWRQLDAKRNSVQMLAQSLFSHKELQGLSAVTLIEKIKNEKNIEWDSLETWKKWGSCCKKVGGKWIVDENTPFLKENWDYIYSVFDYFKQSELD